MFCGLGFRARVHEPQKAVLCNMWKEPLPAAAPKALELNEQTRGSTVYSVEGSLRGYSGIYGLYKYKIYVGVIYFYGRSENLVRGTRSNVIRTMRG